jgi:hypothetical protein
MEKQSENEYYYESHLYIFPSEIEKLQNPECHIIIVEGEKKTLKIIQEIRKIESQVGKYAVIGISGIYNWLNAPEWDIIKLKDRKVIIFFDEDSRTDIEVVKAEIQLASFLYYKWASQVLSARWDIRRGKGIDNYLVQEPNPSYTLKNLIENAQNTISLCRVEQRMQDIDIVKNFFLRVLEKKPSLGNTKLEYLSIFLENAGIKKMIIKSGIKLAKIEIEKHLITKYKNQIKKIFGVENIIVPRNFLWEEELLKTKNGDIITEFFIVQSIVKVLDNIEGVILKTIKGKEIFISNQVQGKKLKQLLQEHGVWIGDDTLWLVSKYIKDYTHENKASIEILKYTNEIGWNGDQYIAPQTTNDKYIFDPILKGYATSGNKEKEKETVIKILQKGSILGIGYLGAVASLLIKPLKNAGARNFIVFLEGTAEQEKTITAKFGLSLFGNPNKLITDMNYTKAEILFETRKDSLIILDELNTGKLIYDFENGTKRTKKTTKISLRQTPTYRGVLLFTLENSLNNLIKKSDKIVIEAYKRNIIINYSDKKIDKEDIEIIYDSTYEHHGNLLQDITNYILKNTDSLKDKYNEYRKQLSNYKFKGQENHFALLYLAIHILEDILNTNLLNMTTTLHQILEENSED